MTDNLLQYSIRELHQRYVSGADTCPAEIYQQMREDPRQGVQKIYRQLKRMEERSERESKRLDRMLVFERRLWSSGVARVAGVDEAGMGPLAGPVVAAAVLFTPGTRIAGVNDSKRLDPKQRSELAREIQRRALSIGVGISEVKEIDRLNIYHAGLLAMKRAIAALSVEPEHLLVDGRTVPGLATPQERLVKGDQRSFVIAAASIIAKTARDKLMQALDNEYPAYGFARHKGYGTLQHREALKRLGPVEPHRRSFSLIREPSTGLFEDLDAEQQELSNVASI